MNTLETEYDKYKLQREKIQAGDGKTKVKTTTTKKKVVKKQSK